MENKLLHHQQTMQKFKDLITREKTCAQKVDATQNWAEVLDNAAERTKDTFTVLTMGNFSAGKTTMVNALIGERLLPMSATPTTAVMTELKYGEKKIIMYPKKGVNIKGKGSKPFSVPATTESIAKYITIDNEAGINVKAEDSVKISSQFEKIELFWPLELLKNGVTIVDSPGLNDPYCNDEIVKNYLPKADAVIYASSATAPYSKQDKDELTGLNNYGIRNIIFAFTYWDQVAFDGEASMMKTKKYCLDNAKKHTDLGEKSVRFLSSREGLMAHIQGDEEKWIESGYKGFVDFLADYLTEARGRDKVNNIFATMNSEGVKIKKYAEALNNNAFQDAQLLQQRMANAQKELDNLESSGDQIAENFALKLKTKRPGIEKAIDEFLPTLRESVDLDDFTPETKMPEGLARLNPAGKKDIAQKIYDEVQEEYERRLKKSVQAWVANDLFELNKEALQYASNGIKNDVDAFSESLGKIQEEITGAEIGEADSGTASNVLTGVVYGLVTGDWFTAGSVAVFGKETMLRQIGFQAAWGAIAGVAVLAGAPITLPVLVIGGIVASALGIVSGKSDKKVAKMKRDVLGKLRAACFDKKDGKPSAFITNTKASILKGVDGVFDKAADDVRYAMEEDIRVQKESVEAVLKNDKKSESEKKQEIQQRKDAVEELEKVIAEAQALKDSY
ncbi:MAG: dynamin family protein [Clostridia bacterium]|nr:dynamin family protein [Clostridia bacterium]